MSQAPSRAHAPFTRKQARRMAAAWREIEPTRAELKAAQLRFRARGVAARRVRRSPLVLALASLFIASASFGAAAVVRYVAARAEAPPLVTPPPPMEMAAPAHPKAGAKGHRVAATAGADAGAAEAIAEEVPELPAVAAAPEARELLAQALPPSAPAPAAAPVEKPRAIAASGPAVPPVTAPLAPAPAVPSTDVPPAAPPAPSPWVVAASAMRAGDYATAERAFADLARSPDAKTRDGARLARAQVWLAQGRASAAIPELQELAVTGASPLVRQRAADELRAASQKRPTTPSP